MLSGRRPFEGQTFAEITDRVLHADPDPLASSSSPVPPALDAIVRRALQKNAAFRYQTARDLYTDLHQLGRRLDALDTSRAMLPVSASMPQVHEPDPLSAPRSIAVMSFDNLTRNGSDDWIGEGIAETVTSDLKNLGGLSVISRTQVFEGLKNLPAAHTADNRAAIELGRHLGASWVVTGAYQRLGPRVRITAQVVDMATAALIKTLKIDGAVDEIFELQDRIVFELSRSLDLVVERPAAEAIATDETTSVEAFEAYSRGLVNLRQATRDSIERAIALFEHATELDPRYARAWASLGGAFQIKGMFLAMPEFTERAIDRLQRAIALAPSFAEAHASLGLSLLNLGRIEEAESYLRRAVSLDENNTTAVQGLARALWLGTVRAHFVSVPGDAHTRRYYQQLTRLSSGFALMADAAMFVLGGSLKRRERLSARLGDILSQLYLASAALKRFADDGGPADDLPLLHWSIQDALHRTQEAFYGLFENLPNRAAAFVLRHVIFPNGKEFDPPKDQLGQHVVQTLLEPSAARDRLTAGVYVPKNPDESLAALELALRAAVAAEPVEAKIRAAAKADAHSANFGDDPVAHALAQGTISKAEAETVTRAQALRRKVIMVDDFPRDLGKSEIFQTTEPVTFEALQRKSA